MSNNVLCPYCGNILDENWETCCEKSGQEASYIFLKKCFFCQEDTQDDDNENCVECGLSRNYLEQDCND